MGTAFALSNSMSSGEKKVQKMKEDQKTPEGNETGETPKRSKIGRHGAGSVGQNWSESPDVAKKGRYADGNKIQGDHPDHTIDTDVSEAV
jgi:hypothetical protein